MNERQIARRLKDLREKTALSLRALAHKADVAPSFLSGLERGKNNVSVATLKSILDALGTNLGEFFSQAPAPPAKVVFRRAELVEISGQRKGISFKEVAAGRPGRALQLLVERYQPGADTGSYRHESDEGGVVLKGTLELVVEDQVYVLRPGDAYYFDSRLPHRFRNRGKVTVQAISVNAPPSF